MVSPDAKPQSPGAKLPANAPRNEEAVRMRKVLASDEGKARYALRKSTVEPVFGQIKEARGIRRFRLRGLAKVTSEWKFICATHNLLKLFRHRLALGSHPNHFPPHVRRCDGRPVCKFLRPITITRFLGDVPGSSLRLSPLSLPNLFGGIPDVLSDTLPDTRSLFALWGNCTDQVAVGTVIADRPPHRSVRAELPHTAPTSDE